MIDDQPTGTLLTAAIICRNEARNIDRCLLSIFEATEGISREIIVVDSASTDDTVEKALRFPVRVIQLRPDWPLSPAAGRYFATLHARGEFLLIIDGDMELLPDFIENALKQIVADPRLAAVRGRVNNFHLVDGHFRYANSMLANGLGSPTTDTHDPLEIDAAIGTALFRRKAVLATGNFHPFLNAEEEYELSWRLRKSGYRILYLPIDAVAHYGYEADPLKEVLRRFRHGLVGGIGQMARVAFSEGYGLRNLIRLRVYLVTALFSLCGTISLLLAFLWPLVTLGWFMAATLLFFIYLKKTGTPRASLAALLLNTLIGIDIFRGLHRRVPERNNFPQGVLIREGKESSR